MSSVQNQKLNMDHSLSFEDASKLFSLPLSEAADILGVSTSLLKKICNENGLERWPHRKYLAGKTIEDIKKEAAKEKSKSLGGITPKSIVTIPSTPSSSPASHFKDKIPRSTAEMPKSLQQPGTRPMSNLQSHHMLASGLPIDTTTFFDEFKYGFPSSGLSECTNTWWGTTSVGNAGASKDNSKTSYEVKKSASSLAIDTLSVCEEETHCLELDSECDMHDEISISAIRKSALEEVRKGLKLSVLKKYGADKLGNEEKILLRRLYQTN